MARIAHHPGAALIVGLAGLVAACFSRPVQLKPAPLGAQSVSLLGDTLWSVPMSIGEAQLRLDALIDARRRQARTGGDLNARLLLARRTAEMGRLREAFELYSAVLAENPTELRARRRRAEIFLLLRELGPARSELRHVVERSRALPLLKEYVDVPGGLAESGVFFSSALLLGITDYLLGDFGRAAAILSDGLAMASDADESAAGALWLFFALRRAGRGRDAAAILGAVPADLPVLRRRAEHRLLRFFQGGVSLDSLRRIVAADPGSEEEVLDLYGLGFALLVTGQAEDAREVFEQARSVGSWATIPYLAAEAELARLAGSGPTNP